MSNVTEKNGKEWYHSKDALTSHDNKQREGVSSDNEAAFILSKDSNGNTGAKAFAWFKTSGEKLAFLEANGKGANAHYYEVIPDIDRYPCYLFFDIDRNLRRGADDDILSHVDEYFEGMVDTFLRTLERFLNEVYELAGLRMRKGQTVQLSSACSAEKLSCHVRVSAVICKNIRVMKDLVRNFAKYVWSNVHTDDADRNQYLTYQKSGDNWVPIFDESVYTNFRSFRCIYSRKCKPFAVPLMPYGGSSDRIVNHLVVFNGEKDARCNDHRKIDETKTFTAKVDYTRADKITLRRSAISLPDNSEADATSAKGTSIPAEHLALVQRTLSESQEVKDILQSDSIRFAYNSARSTTLYNFCLDKKCNYVCPYKSIGRPHGNNRSYFQYNHETYWVQYRCFNEGCKAHCKENGYISVRLFPEINSLREVTSLNNTRTLHCKNELIRWDETYDEETMREYPLVPLCVVRGNMGTAKTKVLVEQFIARHALSKNVKCLFVTYQRMLARKYHADLKKHGFVNYLDVKDEHINASKVIVCLDSLCRISTTNFNFVFMDEVTSVLLHFNSSLLKNSNAVCTQLELFLYQADHVYLLDACADNTIVSDFVQYFEEKKRIKTYFIKNTHVRPTNRRVNLIRNRKRNTDSHKILKHQAFESVMTTVKEGKKLVVASSTKKFTEQLKSELQSTFEYLKILIYNSDCADAMTKQTDTSHWRNFDVLIYSPSITAGLSFESHHFHRLVAWVENSQMTPPVDIVLQQLFRVRQLIDGDMTIYLNDSVRYDADRYPTTVQGVDAMLDSDVGGIKSPYTNDAVSFQSHTKIGEDMRVTYDKTVLSYKILRGILVNKNKSLLHFNDILIRTLEEDYRIPWKHQRVTVDEDSLDRAIELQKRIRNVGDQEELEYTEEMFDVNDDKYEDLTHRAHEPNDAIGGGVLTPMEQQQKWCYECAWLMWGINVASMRRDALKLERLYHELIGSCVNRKSVSSKYELFYRMTRCRDVLGSTNCEQVFGYHMSRMQSKLQSLTDSGKQYNIELYSTRIKSYYVMLANGHAILNALFPENKEINHAPLLREDTQQPLKLTSARFYERATSFLKEMSGAEYDTIVHAAFTSNRERYGKGHDGRDKTSQSEKRLTEFIKGLLNEKRFKKYEVS